MKPKNQTPPEEIDAAKLETSGGRCASPCSAGFRYWEAEIVSRDNRGTLIEWHDGQRERLKGGIDWPLHCIADGCTLGVWVKLGDGDRVIELWPDVEIISSPNVTAQTPPDSGTKSHG